MRGGVDQYVHVVMCWLILFICLFFGEIEEVQFEGGFSGVWLGSIAEDRLATE